MPDPFPRPPSLLAQPTYLAARVARYGVRELEAVLREHGLRLLHHGMLVALDDFGPLSQQELAGSLDQDKSHIVRAVDHLEGGGLVIRSRERDDRRRNRISLTDAGRALVRDLAGAERRSQRDIFEALDADEQDTLTALLRRVLDHQQRRRLDGVP